MSKKIVISLLVVLLVCVGIYLALPKGAPQPVARPGTPAAAAKVDVEQALKGSLLEKLSDNTLCYIGFSMANFKPAADYLKKVRTNFSNTALWQKMGLDQIIDQNLQNPLAQTGQQLTAEQQAARDLLFELLSNLKEFGIVVSDQTVAGPMGVKIPLAMLSVSFSNPELSTKAKSYLLERYKEFSADAGAALPLSVVEKGTDTLEVVVNDPQAGGKFTGSLVASDGSLRFLLGTQDSKAFISDQGGLLSNPEKREVLQKSLQPDSAVNVFVDFEKITPLVTSLLEKAAGQSKQPDVVLVQKRFLDNFQGLKLVAGSVNFAKGVNSSSCITYDPASATGQLYQSFIGGRSLSPGEAGLQSLVNPNTLLALKMAGQALEGQIEAQRRSWKTLVENSPGGDQDPFKPQDVLKFVDTLEAGLKKMQLTEVGIIVNTVPGVPTPSAGVYLGKSALPADQLIDELQALIKSVLPQELAAGLSLEIVPAADGSKSLTIAMGPMQKLYAGKVADNSILISMDSQTIASAAMQLTNNSGSYIQKHLPAQPKFDDDLVMFDHWLYLSSGPGIEMAKGLLPLFGAQLQQQGVTPEEAVEVADLLKTTLFSFNRSFLVKEGFLCVNGSLQTIRLQQ